MRYLWRSLVWADSHLSQDPGGDQCEIPAHDSRDVVPMKSKPALFSLYCASLSFTGEVTEEDPLIVAFENGKYTPEMMAIQATRGLGPEGTNVIA